jgi:hypothetical protein
VAVDPFLIISIKDISFVEVEEGAEVGAEIGVKVGVEVKAFPAIFCIWVDI